MLTTVITMSGAACVRASERPLKNTQKYNLSFYTYIQIKYLALDQKYVKTYFTLAFYISNL